MRKIFVITWYIRLLINSFCNAVVHQVKRMCFFFIYFGLSVSSLGSQEDYDKLKEQVQVVIQDAGVKAEAMEEIMSLDTIDRAITN